MLLSPKLCSTRRLFVQKLILQVHCAWQGKDFHVLFLLSQFFSCSKHNFETNSNSSLKAKSSLNSETALISEPT